MSDWTPQVVRIEKVEKHPGADRLIIVTVMGDYPVITNMTELQVGDLIGYLPIDTIVPDTEEFHFLSPMEYEKYEDENGEIQHRQIGPKYEVGSLPEKYRILKAKKIRGVYSQGMLQPIPDGMNEGDSLVEMLGLKQWEEDEEENVQLAKTKGRNAEKPPKDFVFSKYDINGLRKYLECLRDDEEIVLTEKLHGSFGMFFHDGERLWVKSRNWFKRFDEEDLWWGIAIRYDLENKLSKYPLMAFCGEVYGAVKGFRYDCEIVKGSLLPKVRFFDVLLPRAGRYLDYDDRVAKIVEAGLDPVPELYRGLWKDKEEMYAFAEGQSTLNDKHVREGFVLNTAKERFEPKLQSRMQIKLVGEGYNLKK